MFFCCKLTKIALFIYLNVWHSRWHRLETQFAHVKSTLLHWNRWEVRYVGSDVYKTWTGVHGPLHGPGPWTTMDHPMDQVHGPPHGPDPWTTPNFQKEIAPVNFIWKFTEGQGMKNKDSYLLLTFLRVCLVKASCFGIAAPWMGRPQTRFEIQKI